MTLQMRSSSLQAYQVILYDRALHPELFTLKGRKVITHDGYEFEMWLMPGSHVLRFDHRAMCASELVSDQEDGLPSSGILSAFLCAGERDFDHKFERDRVTYMTSVQTETLAENIYDATLQEMRAYAAAEPSSILHEWDEAAGPCLSLLDAQRFADQVHCQAYHLISQGGLVLRTQSLFEFK